MTAQQVAVGFVRAICPYSWRSDYGKSYNAALADWTTDGYRALHLYPPARASSAAANLRASHEVQTCAGYQAFVVETGTPSADTTTIRVRVIESTSATGAAPSSYVDYYGYQLTRMPAGWRIDADADSGG